MEQLKLSRGTVGLVSHASAVQGRSRKGAGTASSPLPCGPREQEAGTKPSPPLASRLLEPALPAVNAEDSNVAKTNQVALATGTNAPPTTLSGAVIGAKAHLTEL